MDKPITEPQLEFITELQNRLGWDYNRVHTLARKQDIIFSCGYTNLTRLQASKLIKLLLDTLNLDI